MDKLVEYTIRLATNMRLREELLEIAEEPAKRKAAERVAKMLVVEKRGLKYCSICAKGPFTKRGMYLHFMRVHKEDVRALLEKELEQEGVILVA